MARNAVRNTAAISAARQFDSAMDSFQRLHIDRWRIVGSSSKDGMRIAYVTSDLVETVMWSAHL